jgi:ferredoxin
LARTGDLVYGPIGRVLTAALGTDLQPRRRSVSRTTRGLPRLLQPESCNLCSFCVQVCPTRALKIHETEETTALLLVDSTCVACEQCVRACMANALQLLPVTPHQGQRLLRQSPRARCPACGRPTVSQAELEEVAARIGNPTWLNYCSDCRPLLPERVL